ncbi:39S ribosomal protein L33, mitochondrial isoform X3 [Prionailurus bengalensis]|uniref:large ribosomal subunit protein bL33m isoform X3 n=1 Tax=Herpailurus yagouaroundi TaxID=1608482 RepID=UPI001AD69724|nr:39S ribosomal protein L33, mitochondrial isoform X3 [Puma yagouaroundi]XP_043460183.1 39S ribosomal protein L33, mitochondrial isoform X3 [Prionailurus bengalensis]
MPPLKGENGLCPGRSCLLSAFGPISETVGGVVAMFLSAVTFAKSKSNENKSPLCGTEKNTLPLNNGLKMNLIYK